MRRWPGVARRIIAVAGRDSGFKRRDRSRIVRAAASGYREAMRNFAGMSVLAVW
jgi:hypothetical protein